MLAAEIGFQPGERADLPGRGVGLARLLQRNHLDRAKLPGRAIGGQPDLAEPAAAHRADQIEVGHVGCGLLLAPSGACASCSAHGLRTASYLEHIVFWIRAVSERSPRRAGAAPGPA